LRSHRAVYADVVFVEKAPVERARESMEISQAAIPKKGAGTILKKQ